MRWPKTLEEKILDDQGAHVYELSGLPATSLGIFSGAHPKVLDSAKDHYTTMDLFKMHFSRICLTLTIYVYMWIVSLHESILDTVELFRILDLDVKYQLVLHSREPGPNYFLNLFNDFVSYWEVILNIPAYFWKVFRRGGSTPIGLFKCLEYIPKSNTPKSMCLILHCAPPLIKPPPKMPQPYLDSNRAVVIPDKKEVQYVLAIRNEYFTQCKSHVAAERVRLFGEIGRFITWACMVPSLTELTIYEKSGNCWAEDSDYLNSLKNAILVELVTMANTGTKEESKRFKALLPKIVLIEMSTKEKIVINDDDSVIQDVGGSSITVEEIIADYQEKARTLVVYLCDRRVRTTNYQSLVAGGEALHAGSEQFAEEFPPMPELIIGCMNNDSSRDQLEGYACVEKDEQAQNMAVVYFSRLRFGFPFFSRSLYHYSLEHPYQLPAEAGKAGKPDI
ncbi:uncharacterized protein LODBEIA_P43920 [Lodderomyces beijingensis]|uniref:Uncharacterized protein n=1 Tax=Lodderomyces beijingensis TaxID=1775926 RepID=A0ABP0ZPT2_9ASCO